MISLQYIAIVRLDPTCFFGCLRKKGKGNIFEVLCGVYALRRVSFGLNSAHHLPGAQPHVWSVNIPGLQDTAGW